MLSSKVILDDITQYLLTPLTISLSLHSPLCTPCSTNMIQYENKIQSKIHSCKSPICTTTTTTTTIANTSDFYSSNDNSLHMSDTQHFDQLQNNSSLSSPSEQTNRSKFIIKKNSFPQNIFNFITSQIQSLSSQSSQHLTSLIALNDSILQQNVINSSDNILFLYLIFIRRSFYSAQV